MMARRARSRASAARCRRACLPRQPRRPLVSRRFARPRATLHAPQAAFDARCRDMISPAQPTCALQARRSAQHIEPAASPPRERRSLRCTRVELCASALSRERRASSRARRACAMKTFYARDATPVLLRQSRDEACRRITPCAARYAALPRVAISRCGEMPTFAAASHGDSAQPP